IAALLIPLTPRADILFEGRLNLFAVRGDDGKLWVSSKTKEKFVRGKWEDREGGQGVAFIPKKGETKAVSCTERTCTYESHGQKVVIVKTTNGLPRDCAAANLILSIEPFKAKTCRDKTLLLDRWDIWRRGSHAIYLDENKGIRVETVADERGRRPWTGGK